MVDSTEIIAPNQIPFFTVKTHQLTNIITQTQRWNQKQVANSHYDDNMQIITAS